MQICLTHYLKWFSLHGVRPWKQMRGVNKWAKAWKAHLWNIDAVADEYKLMQELIHIVINELMTRYSHEIVLFTSMTNKSVSNIYKRHHTFIQLKNLVVVYFPCVWMLFQFLKKVSFFLELIYKFYFFFASHSTPTSPLVLLSSQTVLLLLI